MDKTVEKQQSIELTSLVNSHMRPFVVIDRDYRIVAANQAYETRYGEVDLGAADKCFKISHGRSRPCHMDGEECPHLRIFETGEPCVCEHFHFGTDHHMHQVHVAAFPIYSSDGELLMGECIEEVSAPNLHQTNRERMVGQTRAFMECLKLMNVAASSDAPVLLQGETGTGKELAAEYIHNRSSRNDKPFQIVDSTVLTETLFESEVFGHERGAYTGSNGEKKGLFELAEGGTLFLDEIGDLPVSQQAKLLRVLESGHYRRVGGTSTRKADVRIICATNRNLWEMVKLGRFREDLFYRIACLSIRLPSLRERIDDLPLLARSLIEGINRSMRASYHLNENIFNVLKNYDYPGNVRELRNILFIAATHSRNREIDAQLIHSVIKSLPRDEIRREKPVTQNIAEDPETIVNQESQALGVGTLKAVESRYIEELLARFNGNRKKAAEALGISERTIYRKLKRLGIN